jgi:hypothetical protein
MIKKVYCQPKCNPRKAISGGATMAPTAAPLLNKPMAVERSSGGNHSPASLIPAGQLPASPIPSKNLQIPK